MGSIVNPRSAGVSSLKKVKKVSSLKILKKVTGQVKVTSKIKIVTFRLVGYQGGTYNSCEPKLGQKASQGMKKVAHKYGPYTK